MTNETTLSGRGGIGSAEIGQFLEFPSYFKPDIKYGDVRYLKVGYIETDTTKFDNDFWDLSRYTILNKLNYNYSGISSSDGFHNIVYANGKFVTGCRQPTANPVSPNCLYSADGVTWANASTVDVVGTVAAGGGMFLMGFGGHKSYNHPDTLKIATSPDGVTWQQRTLPVGAGFSGMYASAHAYGNGLHVIGIGPLSGSVTQTLCTSADGVNWASRTFAKQEDQSGILEITFGNGVFLLATQYGDAANPAANNNIYRSTDGINWNKVSRNNIGTTAYLQNLRFFDGFFYANTSALDKTFKSADGINWQPCTNQHHIITGRGVYTGSDYAFWHREDKTLYRSKNGLDYYPAIQHFQGLTYNACVASDGAGKVLLSGVTSSGGIMDAGVFALNSYLYAGSRQGNSSGAGAAKYVRIS